MRKQIKWILIFFSIIVIGLSIIYFYVTDFGSHNILANEPRNQKMRLSPHTNWIGGQT